MGHTHTFRPITVIWILQSVRQHRSPKFSACIYCLTFLYDTNDYAIYLDVSWPWCEEKIGKSLCNLSMIYSVKVEKATYKFNQMIAHYSTIEGLSCSGDHYAKAVKCLETRYNHPKLILKHTWTRSSRYQLCDLPLQPVHNSSRNQDQQVTDCWICHLLILIS